jgi:phenylacetate-CoA ligase
MIDTFLQFRTLRKNLRLSREDIRTIQMVKLKRLIQHAYDRVPYYRQLFDSAGIRPADIQTLDDVGKIPLTTKDDLKKTPVDQFIASGIDRKHCIEERTSGSTGKPLVIYQSARERYHYVLKMLRIFFENGYKITDTTVGIWKEHGSPITPPLLLKNIGLFRWEIISLHLPLKKRIELLMRLRPEVIYGANSTLRIMASNLLQEDVRLRPPKLLLSTSEIMDNASRELLTRAFGTAPLNIYGANEVGNIAWECQERHGLHMNADCLYLEFLKNGKPVAPNEEGKIVCTNLYSGVMPIIRYDLGDLCIPSERYCSCGRTLPLIERVQGRIDDLIACTNGKLLNRHFFNNILAHYEEVNEYRIIQEDWYSLRLIFAVEEASFLGVTDRFQQDFQGVFPSDMRIKFERVDKIPLEPSGKLRSIISKVKPGIW